MEGICISVWFLFYKFVESVESVEKKQENTHSPLSLLKIGHEILKESNMCVSHQGSFLEFYIQEIQKSQANQGNVEIQENQENTEWKKEWIQSLWNSYEFFKCKFRITRS